MEALEGAGATKAVELVDALVHVLGDNRSSPKIKRLAANALGDIGDPSAIEALVTMLSQHGLDAETG